MVNPIVPALTFNWESTGTSFDGNSLICSGDYNSYDQSCMAGTFCDTGAMAGFPSLDKKVRYDGQIMSVRNLIKTHPEQIKILYKDVPVSSCHYNEANGCIEFVYNNILFRLRISESASDSSTSVIIPNNIENMEIAILNDFNMSLSNEIFISEDTGFILIVNHNYFTGGDYKQSNNIKIFTGQGLYDCGYFWTNAPYRFSLIDAFYDNGKFMFPVKYMSESDIRQPLTDSFMFIQAGYPLYEHTTDLLEPSVFFAARTDTESFSYNPHTGYINMSDMGNILLGHDLWHNTRVSKTTAPGNQGFANYYNIASRYDPNNYINIFKENINDGILDYDVIEKTDNRKYDSFLLSGLLYDNAHRPTTSVYELIEWTKTLATCNLDVYMLRNNGSEKLSGSDVAIDIMPPEYNNKFPSFFIKPAFVNRVDFRSNSAIADNLGITLDNTGIVPNSVEHISSYSYNNITSMPAQFGTGGTIKKVKNFGFMVKNITVPSWQSGTKPSDYKAGLERVSISQLAPYTSMKSFFGSCCVNIPEEPQLDIEVSADMYNIKIVRVTSTEAVNTFLGQVSSAIRDTSTLTATATGVSKLKPSYFKMTVNLTDVFLNYVMNTSGFISNWGLARQIITRGKKQNTNKLQMADFIKKQIMPSYNLENSSIVFKARQIMATAAEPAAVTLKTMSLADKTALANSREYTIDNNRVRIRKQNNGDIVMEILMSINTSFFVIPIVTIPKI